MKCRSELQRETGKEGSEVKSEQERDREGEEVRLRERREKGNKMNEIACMS